MQDNFWGWYFRCQSDQQTIALIPAIHKSKGEKTCSIQLITDSACWNVPFPFRAFQETDSGIEIAGNCFGKQGIQMDLHSSELNVTGALSFGPFQSIRYDIMGPFRYIPFMECKHSVYSKRHTVNGKLEINGIPYVFHNGTGYMEGDRGSSFPKEYAWTQCFLPEGTLMLSVADIPLWHCHFTGIIGVIYWQGKEYRIATYLGATVKRIRDGEIIVEQGRKRLTVRQLSKAGQPLRAPTAGNMSRIIHEQAASKAYYHFQDSGHTVFEFEIPNAAFEYEYLK